MPIVCNIDARIRTSLSKWNPACLLPSKVARLKLKSHQGLIGFSASTDVRSMNRRMQYSQR